jgi:hypothetical protein
MLENMVPSRPAMAERKESRRERFAAELRKGDTHRRLTKMASWLARDPTAAKDLFQSAFVEAYDPNGSPWDPDGEVTFFRHIGNLMVWMALNDRRRFFTRRVTLDGEMTIDERLAGDALSADEQLDTLRFTERARAVQAAMFAALEKDDSQAVGVYRAILDGVEDRTAIAARAGCKPEDVPRAYERLRYHGRRIAQEEEQRAVQEMRRRLTAHAARTVAGASE